MEWITVTVAGATETAPRVAQVRPERPVVEGYYEQFREAMATLVQAGLVHGDLSPYNTLAAAERLVIIDLPQMVDLVGNPQGLDFLLRDCAHMCAWFRSRGLEVDEHELFAELMAHAF
jgi:RIO kinase 1